MLSLFLLLVALAMFACGVLNRISDKLGVPTLLAFLLLGMTFGSDGLLKIPFDDYAFAEQICSVALIFIMFYGGFGTNWNAAKPVASRAVLLSSAGVALTAGFTGVFCHFGLGIAWLESFLIGAVLGSTDAASVFSILRARNLALKENTDSLLEIESGSNDPCAYMLTAVLLAAMQGGISPGQVAYMLFAQLAYGAALGLLIGGAAIWMLKRLQFGAAGFDTIYVVAVAIFAYALPSVLGGNGYLSVYLAGILLGNSDIKNKGTLVPFFDGLTGMMQMLLFFLLGLLCFPTQMVPVLLPALGIALFLTFVARPAAVFLLLAPFHSSRGQKLLASWAGLRGAASIVFAVMTVISPATTNHDLFHIVFMVVLLSILFQGTLLPAVAKRLDMIDTGEGADVRKTFNDYIDEAPVQFIQFTMPLEHPWTGRAVRDIVLPPSTILVALRRGKEQLVPNGSTLLLRGDILVLCARAPAALSGIVLTEKKVTPADLKNGNRICDLPRRGKGLITLVQRGESYLIPRGDTVLEPGDLLVINTVEES